jgi:hypothetical protein
MQRVEDYQVRPATVNEYSMIVSSRPGVDDRVADDQGGGTRGAGRPSRE